MATENLDTKVAITNTEGVIVVTMHPDMEEKSFDTLRKAVLKRVAKTNIRAVVLDFSSVDVMNLLEFDRTRAFLAAVRFLGAETAIVSLSVGVVLYLTEVHAETGTGGINYFFGLDEALQRFGKGESSCHG